MAAVAEQPEGEFAGLLRQLRAQAGLTQEELAEAASLSPRSVSDLERAIHRTAHKDTALLLAGALGLAEPERALFVAAARGYGPAADVLAARQRAAPGAAAATRSLPRDIAAFTGRQAELAQLMGTLAAVAAGGGVAGICAIDGMAGIGKTTFAVHAAHRLAATFPDGQFFLPLHAHTPGQRPVHPADALASLLLTAGVPAVQIPPGLEARAARWRDQVAGRKILLVLDDAAGHEQARPLLPATAGSLVLVTSRRRLTALDDTAVITLDPMPPAEAATLLARLAARAGIGAADPAVGELARLAGYLPLALGMLASQLRHHPAWTPADLAAVLAGARDRLATMRAENLSVAAAFDLSYHDLTEDQRRLFRRLGLIPGPGFDGYAAAALGGTSLEAARRGLEDLYDQHLITEPAPGRYQLHDLLREHARTLAADDDPAESDAAAGRLLDYYLHTALPAGRHFGISASAYRRAPPGHQPALMPDLGTLGQAGAWLDAERANLHAVAEYAADHARFPHAVAIAAAMSGFLFSYGHWDQSAALHQAALAAARRAGDRLGEADTLAALGILQGETGDYHAAAASFARALTLYDDAGDLPGQGHTLIHLGVVHILTGDYPAAIESHQHALALARGFGDRLAEAEALNNLGRVRQRAGHYAAAAAAQRQALELFCEIGNQLGQAVTLNDLGVLQKETGDYPAATASHRQALAIFGDHGDLLGQAHSLNSLGVVQQETGDCPAATASHQQALALYTDLGNRLGQAEALNSLGELSSQTLAAQPARERHTQALAIARSIGIPREEARALEGIGRSYLQERSTDEGVAHLRRALVIYQRIKSPSAQRVQETLRQYALKPASSPDNH